MNIYEVTADISVINTKKNNVALLASKVWFGYMKAKVATTVRTVKNVSNKSNDQMPTDAYTSIGAGMS